MKNLTVRVTVDQSESMTERMMECFEFLQRGRVTVSKWMKDGHTFGAIVVSPGTYRNYADEFRKLVKKPDACLIFKGAALLPCPHVRDDEIFLTDREFGSIDHVDHDGFRELVCDGVLVSVYPSEEENTMNSSTRQTEGYQYHLLKRTNGSGRSAGWVYEGRGPAEVRVPIENLERYLSDMSAMGWEIATTAGGDEFTEILLRKRVVPADGSFKRGETEWERGPEGNWTLVKSSEGAAKEMMGRVHLLNNKDLREVAAAINMIVEGRSR